MAHRGITQKSIRLLLWVLGTISLIFMLLFWGIYQFQLREERSQASRTVNQLLQASLENAMLKRDLPGLKAIVSRLGAQSEILEVIILNPEGEVRFASSDRAIGSPFELSPARLCEGCEGTFSAASESTHFLNRPDGGTVLRSVNPVRNKPSCVQCHGPIEQQAVNGILLVDYDAESIFRKARTSIMWLSFAGLIVLIGAGITVWRFMNRHVLIPLTHLGKMSDQLAQGNLQARANIQSRDEFELLGNSFDIMAERLDKSLQQLLDKEDYLQALIDAIPDGIRVIDMQHNIILSNKSYQTQLGLSDDASCQQICYKSSHQRESPCPPTLMACPLHEIAKNVGSLKTMQHFKRADGSEFEVQVFAAPLKVSPHGKMLVVESIRNLSEDIRFSHEQKLSAVGQLATGVAHEIHNPLSSIRIALKSTLLKLEIGTDSNKDISNYLRLVDGEIDKCIDVTRRLLDLSGFGGDKTQLLDINAAAEETLSLLKYEAEQNDIRVRLDLSNSPIRILAANQDIRMLVLNLVQNAFHSMPYGGELKVKTGVHDNKVCMSICDNGVGIQAEHKAHIFDPFYSYRADSDQGTGLGLTICQSIVLRYQGEIEIEDVSPHGTCFTVRFPCPECFDDELVE